MRYDPGLVEAAHRALAFSVTAREAAGDPRPLIEVVRDTTTMALHLWLERPDDTRAGRGAVAALLAEGLYEWEVAVERQRIRWEPDLDAADRAEWRAELAAVREAVNATALTDAGWALLRRWAARTTDPF
jgi:hypothetical protein